MKCPKCNSTSLRQTQWELNSYTAFLDNGDITDTTHGETHQSGFYHAAETTCDECQHEGPATEFCEPNDTPSNPPTFVTSWTNVGPQENPKSRLLATIEIEGCPMHLEARQIIIINDNQEFETDDSPNLTDADKLSDVFGVEGHWKTVKIYGNDYALFASPYCK